MHHKTLLILMIPHVQTHVCERHSHPNGAGARTCIHLLLRALFPLIVSRIHQTQAQEDFHRLQTKSQLRLADP